MRLILEILRYFELILLLIRIPFNSFRPSIYHMAYCQCNPYDQTAVKTKSKYIDSHPTEWNWKCRLQNVHDDVIKWKHFPRYWPFVRGIHRWPGNSPHKGHWRGALMFSLVWHWTDEWVNNRDVGDLRRHRVHDDVIAMSATLCRPQYDNLMCFLCSLNNGGYR